MVAKIYGNAINVKSLKCHRNEIVIEKKIYLLQLHLMKFSFVFFLMKNVKYTVFFYSQLFLALSAIKQLKCEINQCAKL